MSLINPLRDPPRASSNLARAKLLERLIRTINNDVVIAGNRWMKINDESLNMVRSSYYMDNTTLSYGRVYLKFLKDLRYRDLGSNAFIGSQFPTHTVSATIKKMHGEEEVILIPHLDLGTTICVDNIIEMYHVIEDENFCRKLDDLVDSVIASQRAADEKRRKEAIDGHRDTLSKLDQKLIATKNLSES